MAVAYEHRAISFKKYSFILVPLLFWCLISPNDPKKLNFVDYSRNFCLFKH